MKKHFSKLTLAIAVALVMSLGVAIPALANPVVGGAVNIAITKEINAPAGTVTPESSFTFNLTQVIESDGAYVPLPAGSLTPAAVTIDGPIEIDFAEGAARTGQVADILRFITWPHAGDFTFVVTEVADTNGMSAPHYMDYSDQAFILIVRVSNTDNGLTPTGAGAYATEPTDGTEDVWVTIEPKLTQLEPGTPGDDGELVGASQLRFVNNYTYDILGTPDDPALYVAKTVEGEFANLTTQYFDFTVELVVPTLAIYPQRDPGFLEATIVPVITDAAGTVIPDRDVTVSGTFPNLTVTAQIKHDERIAFPVLPAGTTFVVTEDAADPYAPLATVISGGGDAVTFGSNAANNANTALTTESALVSNAGANSASFLNVHHMPPFTGLVIGSMPLLSVLLGATLVLTLMFASRSRKRIEQMPAVA